MSYDFTAAGEFLDEIGATPREIKDEIDSVMGELAPDRRFLTIRQTRIYGLLSVLADLVDRICPQSSEN